MSPLSSVMYLTHHDAEEHLAPLFFLERHCDADVARNSSKTCVHSFLSHQRDA